MQHQARTTRSKLMWHLIVPLTFLTFLNSLDRVNVSFAALQMNGQLHLTPERYGFGVGLFFLGYLAFQFPHTFLLQRAGARRWIFATVLLWGSVATCMAFMQTAVQFYVLRVLLGMAESGFAPGIVFLMSQWVPNRFRAVGDRRNDAGGSDLRRPGWSPVGVAHDDELSSHVARLALHVPR